MLAKFFIRKPDIVYKRPKRHDIKFEDTKKKYLFGAKLKKKWVIVQPKFIILNTKSYENQYITKSKELKEEENTLVYKLIIE